MDRLRIEFHIDVAQHCGMCEIHTYIQYFMSIISITHISNRWFWLIKRKKNNDDPLQDFRVASIISLFINSQCIHLCLCMHHAMTQLLDPKRAHTRTWWQKRQKNNCANSTKPRILKRNIFVFHSLRGKFGMCRKKNCTQTSDCQHFSYYDSLFRPLIS